MKKDIPPQHQDRQPGIEYVMDPLPENQPKPQKSSDKMKGKVALITGGDSGIGKAIALLFAHEGADISIVYYDEHKDAEQTQKEIEVLGRKCILIAGDVGDENFCRETIQKTVDEFGQIDTLINNAGEQHLQDSIEKISAEQLQRTFATNIFAYFYMVKAALPHLSQGSTIINSTSVTAYRGSAHLIDYSATKGAIVSFTRSLALSLVEKGIRVNGVAPGPIWTPLIPASFAEDKVSSFGKKVPMKRPGQPNEIAPCYLFLASEDSSYMTGQILHPNGGEIINT